MSQEIELKLTLPRRAVAALRRHPLFAGAPLVGPRQQLENTYFDTPPLLLRERRVALRTRKQGRRWLQTVKCSGEFAGGLSHRPEWEHPYRDAFDFSPVDAPAVRHLLESLRGELQPIFTTHFRRETRRHVPREGVEILMMLDLGEVEAAGRRTPLCELELELVLGSADDLFQLAIDLAQDLPLLPEDLSKAQRGYQLFLDLPLRPMKAPPSSLQRSSSPVQAFRALALDCLRQWQANAQGATVSDDPEFIHQMRVALRRLRSLLRIMAPALPAEFVSEWSPRLGAAASSLGRARDLDVLLESVLGPTEAAADAPPGLAALHRQAETLRREARAHTQATIASGAQGRDLLGFAAALHRLESNALDQSVDLANFASLQLQRLRKRARRRLAEARNHPGAEGLHELRIALKRLRYGLELFQPLANRRALRELLSKLARVQEGLGFLHDLAEGNRHLEEWAGQRPALREAAAFVAGWHGRRAMRLATRLPDASEQVLSKRLPIVPSKASSS